MSNHGKRVQIVTEPYTNRDGSPVRHMIINSVFWMTDDDLERADISRALANARGDCYIGGLGLGCIAERCAALPSVNSVTVVEIDEDVIEATSQIITNDKIRIYEGDCRKDFVIGDSPRLYDYMYWDYWLEPEERIWRELQSVVFPRAKAFLKPGGTMECWLMPHFVAGHFFKP